MTIAQGDISLAKSIVADKLPSLVIAQYHERFFPLARVVPNLVPICDNAYMPCEETNRTMKISFSPSVDSSAWATPEKGTRFDTKGAPETIKMLNRVRSKYSDLKLQIISDIPHVECLRLKRDSILVIDDLVTGSYHLSSLEALSMGIPTLCFIDRRTEDVIKQISGCNHIPWVNTKIEEAENILDVFLSNSVLRKSFGSESRSWMERYWNDAILVKYYEEAYHDLVNCPYKYLISRFNYEDEYMQWIVRDQFEVKWNARKSQASFLRFKSWLNWF